MKGKVVKRERVAERTYSTWIETEDKLSAEPGMFIMVGFTGSDPFLNRPFSIVDIDCLSFQIIFNVRGRGTELLAHLPIGSWLSVTGPWGKELPTPDGPTILVGGGVGIAPLLFYRKRHPSLPVLYGAKSRNHLIEIGHENITYITEDGSFGQKGLVTDYLEDNYQMVIGCGPTAMLAAMKKKIRRGMVIGIFETRMGCGCGICFCCALPGQGRYIRVCKDGPGLPLEEVDFETMGY